MKLYRGGLRDPWVSESYGVMYYFQYPIAFYYFNPLASRVSGGNDM